MKKVNPQDIVKDPAKVLDPSKIGNLFNNDNDKNGDEKNDDKKKNPFGKFKNPFGPK